MNWKEHVEICRQNITDCVWLSFRVCWGSRKWNYSWDVFSHLLFSLCPLRTVLLWSTVSLFRVIMLECFQRSNFSTIWFGDLQSYPLTFSIETGSTHMFKSRWNTAQINYLLHNQGQVGKQNTAVSVFNITSDTRHQTCLSRMILLAGTYSAS